MKRKYALLIMCILFLTSFLSGCAKKSVSASDMMQGISSENPDIVDVENQYVSASADFALEIFKNSLKKGENSLVSPLSVLTALSMTANGAEKETLDQMLRVLACGMSLEQLNQYNYSYASLLVSGENPALSIANSIWIDDDIAQDVKESFLKTNGSYYSAGIFSADFSSSETVDNINKWVQSNTKGMIDNIIDKLSRDDAMVLINAVAFDSEWQKIYEDHEIGSGEFTNYPGEKSQVSFMHSTESHYIETSDSTGFIKPYKGGRYSFAAILPNEGIDVFEYIDTLNGEDFVKMIKSADGGTDVFAGLPKFKYDFEVNMNDALKAMGMTDAFDAQKADFSNIADGGSFIGSVLHKTFIEVDERGTKAGAATSVIMCGSAMPVGKTVTLNRPFVYAIVDNSTGLPVFLGVVASVN